MLNVSQQDAEYILEPVAQLLLSNGVSKSKAQAALRASARRSLRLAAQDRKQSMNEAGKGAGAVARKLVAGSK